jgi:hypothetical protein
VRNLTVKARIAFARLNERVHGQHITLAGEQHITELCDVERVTIHASSHFAGLDSPHNIVEQHRACLINRTEALVKLQAIKRQSQPNGYIYNSAVKALEVI